MYVVSFFILVDKAKAINVSFLIGIDVGDKFYSRAEMVVLGMHGHWMKGIDYMGVKYRNKVKLVE